MILKPVAKIIPKNMFPLHLPTHYYNNILQGHYLPTEAWHSDGKPSITGDSQSIYGMARTTNHRHSSSYVLAPTVETWRT